MSYINIGVTVLAGLLLFRPADPRVHSRIGWYKFGLLLAVALAWLPLAAQALAVALGILPRS